MPYNLPNESPEDTRRMESCVNTLLPKIRANPKKYRVTKKRPAKSVAIAICKSSIMGSKEAQAKKSETYKTAVQKRLTRRSQ